MKEDSSDLDKRTNSDDSLKRDIKTKLINPTYYHEIQNNLKNRDEWKTVGNVFDTLSHLLNGIATILAFAASGFPDYKILSFIAGCVGVCSLVCRQFSSYALNETNMKTTEVNKILTKLGMEEIVDTSINEPVNTTKPLKEVELHQLVAPRATHSNVIIQDPQNNSCRYMLIFGIGWIFTTFIVLISVLMPLLKCIGVI